MAVTTGADVRSRASDDSPARAPGITGAEDRIAESEPPPPAANSLVPTAQAILADLFGPSARRSFAVRLWDGTTEEAGEGASPRFTLVLRRPGALRRMFLPPSELALGEAYLRDDYDIEGDIEAAVGLGEVLSARIPTPAVAVRLIRRLRALPAYDAPLDTLPPERGGARLSGRQHTQRRDAVAVRFHYDAGNDFFALWLDERMVYSCAYFATGEEDLDTAQAAKLEHICRKLRLRPGERLLDIGCGWGGLVRYAAERYGVDATGITLSEPQAAFARARIAAAGLSERCRIEVRDYRDVPRGTVFDKVVSVGMFEHVGRAQLPAYFDQAFRLTKPGGLFLNHGIVALTGASPGVAQRVVRNVWRPASFIERYVFPDGELIAPWETIRFAENAGFETRDVESLREHYALTLRHWVRRLEAHHASAVRMTNEPTYRVWRLYMAGCARGFAKGRIGITQTLLSKPDGVGDCTLPLTRSDLYRETAAPGLI